MPDGQPLAFARASQLADARGDVPDDGSGLDGVWTDEIPDLDTDTDWVLVMNPTDEEQEHRLTEERTETIRPFRVQAWYGTDLAMPAAIFSPIGGQTLVGDEHERSTEDRLIASIEAILDELEYDDYEAVVLDE